MNGLHAKIVLPLTAAAAMVGCASTPLPPKQPPPAISIGHLLALGRLENGLKLMSGYLGGRIGENDMQDQSILSISDQPDSQASMSRSSFVATSIEIQMSPDTCVDFEQVATKNKAARSTQKSLHDDFAELKRYIWNPTSIISLEARHSDPRCLEYISIRDRLPSWKPGKQAPVPPPNGDAQEHRSPATAQSFVQPSLRLSPQSDSLDGFIEKEKRSEAFSILNSMLIANELESTTGIGVISVGYATDGELTALFKAFSVHKDIDTLLSQYGDLFLKAAWPGGTDLDGDGKTTQKDKLIDQYNRGFR